MSDDESAVPDDVFFDDTDWQGRVAYSERGGFAYRPSEILVPQAQAGEAQSRLSTRAEGRGEDAPDRPDEERPVAGHERITPVGDELDAIGELRDAGISAQPNHVLFSHCLCCGGPHGGFGGFPFSANPFSANPFSANPFSANPFSANPFSANPFSANPFCRLDYEPHPLAVGAPSGTAWRASGRRSHSARPAPRPDLPAPPDAEPKAPHIVVIDTGIAHDRPLLVANVDGRLAVAGVRRQDPFEFPDGDADDELDPIAGHGTFIAGIIKMVAPNCDLDVQGPLNGYGDISERDLAAVLEDVVNDRPDLLNLSLGGYSMEDMPTLRNAVRALQAAGTIVVASAGNDATCRPAYPAAFEGVISVGALGAYAPAPFTNYGHWVRACAPGVDVVSSFFTVMPPELRAEPYAGWARWSGTSFATPAVVGALAAAIRPLLPDPDDPQAADKRLAAKKMVVERLIDDPGLFRIPGLGTVVNQTPWWLRA